MACTLMDAETAVEPKRRIYGTAVVWSLPKSMKPVRGLPPGKVRYRFRVDDFGRCFVRSDDGTVSHFIIGIDISNGRTIDTGEWYAIKQGENRCKI